MGKARAATAVKSKIVNIDLVEYLDSDAHHIGIGLILPMYVLSFLSVGS